MFSVRLPQTSDPNETKKLLYDRYHIEAPVVIWNGQPLLRISVQGYNDQKDIDALLAAMEELGLGVQ